MRRSPYRPDWCEPHLLSFVTDTDGNYLSIHADLAGITMLIDELETLREQLEKNDCPHTHLLSYGANSELSSTKLLDQQYENTIVDHVKIYGWNEEWAVKHGLMSPKA
jgi:hypothetical protein